MGERQGERERERDREDCQSDGGIPESWPSADENFTRTSLRDSQLDRFQKQMKRFDRARGFRFYHYAFDTFMTLKKKTGCH